MKIRNEDIVYARRDRSPVLHIRGGVSSTRCGIELGVKFETYVRIAKAKGIIRECSSCKRTTEPKELNRFAMV